MPDEPIGAVHQGSSQPWRERLPLPRLEDMTVIQRAAADALIAGPRKGVFGPFVPLLRSPKLLERVAQVGEYLRFDSVLPPRIREFATCVAARHVSNQFEWRMHAPLALAAGVHEEAIEALRVGARPKELSPAEEAVFDFAQELLRSNGSSEPTYLAALSHFGEQGLVELATLLGYFVTVSWLMNVAHTPAQGGTEFEALPAFPL